MWRAGSFLCPRCGCESDTAGRKVTADTPMPPFPARQWVAVAVLATTSFALIAGMFWVSQAYRAAPTVVALPVVVVPPAVVPPPPAVPGE